MSLATNVAFVAYPITTPPAFPDLNAINLTGSSVIYDTTTALEPSNLDAVS